MSQAIRQQRDAYLAEAHKIAISSMSKPLEYKDYLLNVGRVQQLQADAEALTRRFLSEQQARGERQLPDDDDFGGADDDLDAAQDRLSVARRNHRPRPR